jgi:hypothetical protein
MHPFSTSLKCHAILLLPAGRNRAFLRIKRRKEKTKAERRCLKFGSPEYVVPSVNRGTVRYSPEIQLQPIKRSTSRPFARQKSHAQARPERTNMERANLNQKQPEGVCPNPSSDEFQVNSTDSKLISPFCDLSRSFVAIRHSCPSAQHPAPSTQRLETVRCGFNLQSQLHPQKRDAVFCGSYVVLCGFYTVPNGLNAVPNESKPVLSAALSTRHHLTKVPL